ncbi:hydantoinase B/oxoprolinase family protein [Devosia sp.]|uniref:hydantoinase B/oxoprolinase family protein n=1 Tax=Devosia sp. TaxID=1871048 RepID=UPI002EDF6631
MTQDFGTDLITREVVLSGIRAAVDEMEVVIGRAAMSPIFREKKDYFMGVYDPDGRMVHALIGLSGAGLVQPVLERYPAASIKPGDIFFYNDPYSSAGAVQHLPDVVVLMPAHDRDGTLLGFAAAYGHVEDIGGLRHGSGSFDARDIFNEGIAYPPIRVGQDFEVFEEFMRVLVRNSRVPDLIKGDWRALMAGCRLCVERLQALASRWGTGAYEDTVAWTIARSAAIAERVVREQMVDGRYVSRQKIDGRLAGRESITVAAELSKSGSALTMDLRESDDQVDVPLNYMSSLAGTRLLIASLLLVLDEKLLINEGALSVLKSVEARPGSIVRPNYPAPLFARSTVKNALAVCVADLLSQATSGRMNAPSPVYCVATFSFPGINPPRPAFAETLGVGLGARSFGDGPDVIYGHASRNYPVDQVEPGHPVRIERYEIRQDTGGAGQYRGGCGVRRDVRVLVDCTLTPRLGNTTIPSPGVAGGHPGGLARLRIQRTSGVVEEHPGLANSIPMQAGDVAILETSGGGGWGDPRRRPTEAVLRDVREGFVSEEQAQALYGVCVENGALDRERTSLARGPADAVAARERA